MNNHDLEKKLKARTKAELTSLLMKLNEEGKVNLYEKIDEMFSGKGELYLPGDVTELIVLQPLQRALKCRILKTGEPVTYRSKGLEIPGDTISVEVSKHWKNKNTFYMSGKTLGREFNVSNLNIKPLGLTQWDSMSLPEIMADTEHDDDVAALYESLFTEQEYTIYEMEQIIPGTNFEESDYDPIIESVDLKLQGYFQESCDLLFEILNKDIRCIDAHNHLGNLFFPENEDNTFVEEAMSYYQAGAIIGATSLGTNFDGLLPWGLIDNRPYLRSLHGYGLCLERKGAIEDALTVYKQILRYNPMDNLGVRSQILELE